MLRDPDERASLAERQRPASFRPIVLLAVAAYVVATALTRPLFTGDAPDYADSIAARLGGVNYNFWDAGHLFWRPIGYLVVRLVQPFAGWGDAAGPATLAGAEQTLAWLARGAGLAAAVLLVLWLARVGVSRFAAAVTVLLFVIGHAFLDYAQSGSAYVPGLAFLLLGLYLLAGARGDSTRDAAGTWQSAAGGVALAGAVFMWLLYALALPAALLSPVLLFGASRARWRSAAVATAACAVAGAVAYGAVAVHVGVATPAAFVAWLQQSSHGIAGTGGVARAIFGFARSHLNMGNDGALVKRYMLHDPYNPVTRGDLLRLSLWKVALFYAFVLAVVVGAARTVAGRRALLFAAVTAAPTVAFALAWQAGDLERYLPLLPALCLAVAFAAGGWAATAAADGAGVRTVASSSLVARAARAVILLFVVVAAAVNVRALSAAALADDAARVTARVGALADGSLPPRSMVVTANWHDELVNFARANPGRSINARARLPLYALVTPGSETAPRWRAEFAQRALAAWRDGGQVWLSRRALAPRPAPTWNWIEGDDARVSWGDFAKFFAPFDLGPRSVGGADGFVLLPRTAGNEARLRAAVGGGL